MEKRKQFVGGPGSSGIFVFNERIYDPSLSPTTAGGGTVDFVSMTTVNYSNNIEVREKAGTPGVLPPYLCIIRAIS